MECMVEPLAAYTYTPKDHLAGHGPSTKGTVQLSALDLNPVPVGSESHECGILAAFGR